MSKNFLQFNTDEREVLGTGPEGNTAHIKQALELWANNINQMFRN